MTLLGRNTLVTGPVEQGIFLLETFQGKEVLGTPYRYHVTLLSTDPNIPADKVFGQPMTIHIKLDAVRTRYFNGIVTYFAKTGLSMRHTRYVAILKPMLSVFDHARDCRVINEEGQTALSIVTDCLAQRKFTDVDARSLHDHVYLKRDYCVQYRETDRNFVQRLLEEEGIYYFFKHEDGKHTMVLADSLAAHAKAVGYESVMYLPKERRQAADEEHFWSLRVARSLSPGDYTVVRGYDYSQPRPQQTLFGVKTSEQSQPGTDFEDYDYPGGFSMAAEADGEALVRSQIGMGTNTIVEVEGNTTGIGVGDLVKLRRSDIGEADYNPFWKHDDFKKDYLVTSANYRIRINQHETGDRAGADEPFKATYSLLDCQTQFRPRRTAIKPRIEGPQTALVVGPADKEIHTDPFGRVKVQFDWDRLGNRDDSSSCWIRVAHVWAGKQWGAIHIPRIGQEVIVEFLNGDPDRPIVTGRVYNADNMPPYELPAHKTQSGIKSRSSTGGSANNYNEIRFEDLKGKEELHIQAERDMSTHVKRDESLTVAGDRTVTVTGNQSVTISGKGSSDIHSSTKVTGKYDLDVSDTIHIKAPTSITLECQGSKIEMLPGKVVITAGDGATFTLDANVLAVAKGEALLKLAADVTTVAKGGAALAMNENVLLTAKDGGMALLSADAVLESNGKSSLRLDGDATLTGHDRASVGGTSEAKLSAGGYVKISDEGVEASGEEIKLNG